MPFQIPTSRTCFGLQEMMGSEMDFMKAAALSGEAISGNQKNGKYYLAKSKKEIAYYKKRAEQLLQTAHTLMDIYRENRANELNAFLLSDA